MAEQTAPLDPGESKIVSFEATPHEAKTYSVSVDGLSGSFVATEEVIAFDLARPMVAPAEVTPGTAITITCPVTSRCANPQTVTAKVIIYEGSILPGHGIVIATKTSPSFSPSPGETYDVIVHHTAVAGTIDRRDIEVEVYAAARLVKESEWDDVYYVEIALPSATPESIWTDLIAPKLDYLRVGTAGGDQWIYPAVETGVLSGLRALGEWSAGDIHELALTMLMGAPYREEAGYDAPYVGITDWQSFEAYVRMSSPTLNNQVDEIMALGGTFQDWVAYRICILFNKTYVIGFLSDDEIRQVFDAYGVSLSDLALRATHDWSLIL